MGNTFAVHLRTQLTTMTPQEMDEGALSKGRPARTSSCCEEHGDEEGV